MATTKVKLLAFGDSDSTSDAEKVIAAMMKETEVSQYIFLGDGPYANSGTAWVSMMKKSFDDKKDKMMWTRGNHDEDESESKQTQKDMEAWFPEAAALKISDCWLMSKQVGNVYIISMDTQDLRVEFEDEQFEWVRNELEKAKTLRASGQIDWIVVLFHKPFFTEKTSHSPYTAVRFMYREVFRDAQVDFCLSGHNHNTQLWKPMIPNDSKANGEGEELFTLAADAKTFDFSKDHGAAFIVSGMAGHEWNKISEQNPHVMFHKDSGNFGFTSLEFDGKNAKVLSKDSDNKVDFEYPVTRETGGNGGPPEPPKCPDGQHYDSTQGKCVPNDVEPPPVVCGPNEHYDPIQKKCVPNDVVPPNPGSVVCPRDFHYSQIEKRCVPDLEPPIDPACPAGYTWSEESGQCVKDGGTIPPEPCPAGQHRDSSGNCVPDIPTCPPNQHWDPVQQKCVPDTTNPPPHVCPPNEHWDETQKKCIPNTTTPPPTGTNTIDEFGTKLPFKLTGKFVDMQVGGDPAGNGQRYNADHKFTNYVVAGYYKTGDGQELIELKLDGPHHSGHTAKKAVNTWTEPAIYCADGQARIGSEFPHPKNHKEVILPSFKKVGQLKAGEWAFFCPYAYQSGEYRTIGILASNAPFTADGKKPSNNWIVAAHTTDKGEICNIDGDNPDGAKRKIPPENGEVLEAEIRCHGESKGHGNPGGTDMKWARIYEIENPNTEEPPILDDGDGGTTNPPPPPPPINCPPGQHLENGVCVPDTTNPPPPPPPPPTTGNEIWNSNIHLKTGQKYTITDTYGDQKPDGKGIFMAASGSPHVIVEEDGTFWLEADAGHGRMYIKAINYNAIMEGEIMFPDSFDVVRNSTQRLRSRHQEGGDCANRGGGFGQTIEVQEQLAEYETESCHNLHENSIKKPLTKKIEQGKWIKFRYTCKNSPDNKKALFNTDYDYNDGNGWVNVNSGEHPNPPAHLMDEALNLKESYAWLRINNDAKGKVGFRNVRILKI